MTSRDPLAALQWGRGRCQAHTAACTTLHGLSGAELGQPRLQAAGTRGREQRLE